LPERSCWRPAGAARWRVVVVAVAAGSACGGRGAEAPQPEPAPSPSTATLEALYRARADSALARFTEADADFMARMIGHHAQALAMAALVPTRGRSAQIHTLAARITTAQEAEIALMRRWLEDRGRAAPREGESEHVSDAPGMLTAEQMRSLEDATGEDFDRLFLTLMIQHHRGAVTMVERLFETPGAAGDTSTFRIASGIQVDQMSEIARMEAMLAAPGDTGRDH
jgi:uncharacterized protein (DUF305 family)